VECSIKPCRMGLSRFDAREAWWTRSLTGSIALRSHQALGDFLPRRLRCRLSSIPLTRWTGDERRTLNSPQWIIAHKRKSHEYWTYPIEPLFTTLSSVNKEVARLRKENQRINYKVARKHSWHTRPYRAIYWPAT